MAELSDFQTMRTWRVSALANPAAFMRLSVSRQEMPASTKMLAHELESTVEFPLLPLAKTVMRMATKMQHNGSPLRMGVVK